MNKLFQSLSDFESRRHDAGWKVKNTENFSRKSHESHINCIGLSQLLTCLHQLKSFPYFPQKSCPTFCQVSENSLWNQSHYFSASCPLLICFESFVNYKGIFFNDKDNGFNNEINLGQNTSASASGLCCQSLYVHYWMWENESSYYPPWHTV